MSVQNIVDKSSNYVMNRIKWKKILRHKAKITPNACTCTWLLIFLKLYRHFNNKWRRKTGIMGLSHPRLENGYKVKLSELKLFWVGRKTSIRGGAGVWTHRSSLTHLCFIDNIEHKQRFTTLLHQTPSIRHLLNGMTKESTRTAFTFICTVLPYNKALLSIGY